MRGRLVRAGQGVQGGDGGPLTGHHLLGNLGEQEGSAQAGGALMAQGSGNGMQQRGSWQRMSKPELPPTVCHTPVTACPAPTWK